MIEAMDAVRITAILTCSASAQYGASMCALGTLCGGRSSSGESSGKTSSFCCSRSVIFRICFPSGRGCGRSCVFSRRYASETALWSREGPFAFASAIIGGDRGDGGDGDGDSVDCGVVVCVECVVLVFAFASRDSFK